MNCMAKCPEKPEEKKNVCCNDCDEKLCRARCHGWKFDCRMLEVDKKEGI